MRALFEHFDLETMNDDAQRVQVQEVVDRSAAEFQLPRKSGRKSLVVVEYS
jgi:hypothetical protein